MKGKGNSEIFVSAEHKDLIIGRGEARLIGSEIANGFAQFINQKKWHPSGSGLDWSGIRSVKLILDRATPDDLSSFLQRALIGQNRFILALLSEKAGAIVGNPRFILENLDAIYLSFPGVRFLIGSDAKSLDAEMRLSFKNFAECIDGRVLTAEMRDGFNSESQHAS